ncbi:MAG TPA: MMPL family transporter [Acidimicrobiales bacterium]|jgi:RND superfamily putative drug exporter|nr:MMPL family transporter [Acidimicrobiales bacterium]
MSSKDSVATIEETRMGRLARTCYHRRWRVLAAWIIALVVITGISQTAKGKFSNKFSGGHSQAQLAQNLLTQRFPAKSGDTADAVFKVSGNVTSPQNQAAINAFDQQLLKLPHILAVVSPFGAQGAGQLSRTDPSIAYSVIQFDKITQDIPVTDLKMVLAAGKAANHPGFEVALSGQPIEAAQGFQFGLSEVAGFVAAMIILLIAFGSLVAMGIPLLVALFGLFIGVGLVSLASHLVTVPTFATELAVMIGLGVGIDYALFIVTRYRQGLDVQRLGPERSIIIALATSGRAVLLAGSTVIISLFGMMLMGLSFVYGLAWGAIVTVIMVMLASLTLLPAILGFAGPNIDLLSIHRRRDADHRQTLSWRWSRVIQRHPWAAGLSALLVLVVLAIPLFSMHLAFSDAGNDPASFTTRQAYDLLAQGFGPGVNGPLVIAASLPPGATASSLTPFLDVLRRDPDVAFVPPATLNPAGNTAIIEVIPKTSPQSTQTESLVKRVRADAPATLSGTGITTLVGGQTAGGVDVSVQLAHRLFLVIGLVVLLSFLLLMAVFRSIAVPVKAAIMNLLSIGAAYGVMVAVFQWGWLKSIVGIDKVGPIDPWIPLMLFTILFGLSMDYEVFLLSRIREEWLRTHDNANSVADGLAATARVITAAAAIMCCVFIAFVLGDLRILKVFGLGLATAVFVDASLVRMVLVPATMELLGNANWWFPRWLDRAVPTIAAEVTPPEPERELVGAGAVD